LFDTRNCMHFPLLMHGVCAHLSSHTRMSVYCLKHTCSQVSLTTWTPRVPLPSLLYPRAPRHLPPRNRCVSTQAPSPYFDGAVLHNTTPAQRCVVRILVATPVLFDSCGWLPGGMHV
jgi:hypothetical protein